MAANEHSSGATPALPSIKTLSRPELEDLMGAYGQPAYRGRQLYEWLHSHHVTSFDAMTNVPKSLRAALAREYSIPAPTVITRREADDGTVKYLLDFGDVEAETVAIPADKRLTVCFSTQAGCGMGCRFCATGQQGFYRNLTAEEIVDQLAVVERDLASVDEASHSDEKRSFRITNGVAMGQGEPLANYDALLTALRICNDPEGFAIGARKLTVSTCGLIDGIQRFAHEPEQFGLAVSLHSAIQSVRDELMPGLRGQPLDELKAALVEYEVLTKRRVTLEYALMNTVNDDEEALQALIGFCRGGLFHVNLLPLHPVDDADLMPSDHAVILYWEKALTAHGIPASLRTSRGLSVDGACGQLANKR